MAGHLDAFAASLNDKFNRAQWKYCPIEFEEEISKDIIMGFHKKVLSTVDKLVGWTARDLNYVKIGKNVNPIIDMFLLIRSKKLETCPIFCIDPDRHFSAKQCFPVYKVYKILKDIDATAAKHLESPEFRKRILENVEQEERLRSETLSDPGIEKVYPIYALPPPSVKNNTKKKIVLTIDYSQIENFQEDDITFFTGLNNLLDNINQNFTCMMTPAMKIKVNGSWINFVSNQIKNANIIIVVFSPLMTETLLEWQSCTGPSIVSSEINKETDGLRFLWNTIKSSNKPIIGAVFEPSLGNDCCSLIPVVFDLPKNLKLLLGYLLHRLEYT